VRGSRRLGSGGTTANSASEPGLELAGSLLGVTVFPPPVSLTVTASGSPVGTVSAGTSLPGRGLSSDGLLVGVGDDLAGKVEELPEVVQTLGGEGVVVPLPRELGLDESLGGQGLHGLDDLQVSDVGDIGVSGSVEVLLGDHDSLLEEGFVDGPSVLLGDKHIE